MRGKVISRKFYKIGYEVRTELIEDMGEPFAEMKSAYNISGYYIGDPKTARVLFNKVGLTLVELAKPENQICSIGFNPNKQKWYGWSHRAIVGFKIGNKIFEEKYGNDKTLFINHGKLIIKTLADAKQAAINFANYIS